MKNSQERNSHARSTAEKLVQCLADGNLYSGSELAKLLGISRAGIWKNVHKLRQWGVPISATPSRGYSLAVPLDLMDETKINAYLSVSAKRYLQGLHLLGVVDSTNSYLKSRVAQLKNHAAPAHACIAEMQTAGRGRRGREWVSPYGANLYMSLAWRFDELPADISSFSLVLGIIIVETLEKLGIHGMRLKWPNDLYFGRAKLGGLLTEVIGEPQGESYVIAGIGINVAMPETARSQIDQEITDLCSVGTAPGFSRNRLVAALINSMCEHIPTYALKGAKAFLERWPAYDICKGQSVRLLMARNTVQGVALGIDAQGRLLLKTERGVEAFISGEISLRFNS